MVLEVSWYPFATGYIKWQGTTYSMVLTRAIFTEGCKSMAANLNVGIISVIGEREIGKPIARTMKKVVVNVS
ncbi:chaperonin CPN60, mitochondrial [Olea europaea subsp. europaea]|uniref:Chaperonin CPN60, mitochondrial n=1 Tax=Olea europaea subsp. europaea TaxID=158383 RepID=A0A8S0UMX6_OLEEU|nr:chaperonin CPN60, mitochondrial [Olea europaea subsp. europaea]